MTTQKTILTADELIRLPDDGMRHELVKGELRTMPPAGGEHGEIAFHIGTVFSSHVRARDLGHLFAAETGFRIGRNPDTVRAPDVAFVAKGRLPGGRSPRNYPELAPDLVVEVMSPWDTAREINEKARDWLRAGVRAVVVVYPRTQSVRVHRSGDDVRLLGVADELDLVDVLPGFRCAVGELFPDA